VTSEIEAEAGTARIVAARAETAKDVATEKAAPADLAAAPADPAAAPADPAVATVAGGAMAANENPEVGKSPAAAPAGALPGHPEIPASDGDQRAGAHPVARTEKARGVAQEAAQTLENRVVPEDRGAAENPPENICGGYFVRILPNRSKCM
jgi:hypothetical protein